MWKRGMSGLLIAGLAVAGLAGCSSEDKSPYLEIRGGGFIFNYRVAEAYEGLVAAPLRPLPEGSVIEASFENPAGGEPIVIKEPVSPKERQFEFRTPGLTGIVADKPYTVTLRLLAADGKELQRVDKKFHSQVDQSVLPAKPLTIGPGYAKNPELDPNAGGSGN